MKSCLMFAFFYPLHSPDISTCSRGIQPILQKYEDAIESAKSAANALKRRLNLGFGRRFLCPVIWTDDDWIEWWETEADENSQYSLLNVWIP